MDKRIVLIINNIRSTHNVGSIMRTADGFGVKQIYFTGYTPYPGSKNDNRLPHISSKLSSQIHKTALGAENTIKWSHSPNIHNLINQLKSDNYEIIALEQNTKSISINEYYSSNNVAIILGNEVSGIDDNLLQLCDTVVEIPMFGKKESFNVVQATAIMLYQIRVISQNKH